MGYKVSKTGIQTSDVHGKPECSEQKEHTHSRLKKKNSKKHQKLMHLDFVKYNKGYSVLHG